jgi:hypothetical protein
MLLTDFENEAKLYLENLQKQLYEYYDIDHSVQEAEIKSIYVDDKFVIGWLKSRNEPHDQLAIDNFKKELEKIREEVRLSKPTKYEVAEWHSLLRGIVKQFDQVFKILSYNPPQHYLFGTLPTNRVNGMAMAIPDNPYKLIILETGLFGFANLMCKVLATSFVFKNNEDGMMNFSTNINECKSKIDSNPIIVERFYDVLTAYTILGNPHYAQQYFLDSIYEPLSSILRNGVEYFVFAHEFGHLISGHLDNNERNKKDIGDSEIEAINTNWQQEFEADVVGANILINAMGQRGYDISISYWGIEVFFGCIDVVEKTISILKTGSSDLNALSETHPPTVMRRDMLRELVSKSFNPEKSEAIISLSKFIELIIKYLWQKVEPKIFALKENKVQLSNHWQ